MKFITSKIIEKKEQKAVLEILKQKITIPLDYLPPSSNEGLTLKLYFLNPENGVTEEKKLAKIILEEILNGK